MAAKPLTTEAIALTEKKMDMTLDDIIKMSKNPKTMKQRRVPIKKQMFSNNFPQDKASKVWRHMESRSSLRQGALAKRRSNFQANQFPVATEVAKKAATAPLHFKMPNWNRVANWNKATPLHFKMPNRNRVANWNKARSGVPANQRRSANGGFAAKQSPSYPQELQENVDIMPKQKPQTLDALFANINEQRMRVSTMRNNAVVRNGGGNRRTQWGRGRYGN